MTHTIRAYITATAIKFDESGDYEERDGWVDTSWSDVVLHDSRNDVRPELEVTVPGEGESWDIFAEMLNNGVSWTGEDEYEDVREQVEKIIAGIGDSHGGDEISRDYDETSHGYGVHNDGYSDDCFNPMHDDCHDGWRFEYRVHFMIDQRDASIAEIRALIKPRFMVGENDAGFMPDVDPDGFGTVEAARDALVEIMRDWADTDDEEDEGQSGTSLACADSQIAGMPDDAAIATYGYGAWIDPNGGGVAREFWIHTEV